VLESITAWSVTIFTHEIKFGIDPKISLDLHTVQFVLGSMLKLLRVLQSFPKVPSTAAAANMEHAFSNPFICGAAHNQ
jgi:hypothetical protein